MPSHKIMVVDDNVDMLHVYARIFSKEGFEVITAETGEECLKKLASVKPDIFMMDVMLPDWNGIELVKEIKKRVEFEGCIFVLLSGLKTDYDSRMQGLEAGAVDYLLRPLTNKEVLAKIKSLIKIMDFQKSIENISKELELRVIERTKELEATVDLLRESEEQQSAILKFAMDGFWLVDKDARLRQVNETYCKMSGYSEQELLDMKIFDLEAEETKVDTFNRLNLLKERFEDRFESKHRCKDGKIIDVEVSMQYQPLYGGRFICFIRDISLKKQMQ